MLLDVHQTRPPITYDCSHFISHCDSLRCPYGILKSYDSNSECQRCECENPCAEYQCPEGSKCSVDVSSDQYGETVFVAVCRENIKPGQCPSNLERHGDTCENECLDDADCRGDHKCCAFGCSKICTLPEDEQTESPTNNYPQAHRPTELENVPEVELRPVAREGGVATLRCFATGFPPPSITWKRGGIEVHAIN